MRTDEFDYTLPERLIAQHPPEKRGSSRLLYAHGEILEDILFADLPSLVRPDDVLVLNDTRVIKARLSGSKESGGKIELESASLARKYAAPLPTFRPVQSGFPLALLSPASDRRISSTFGGLSYSDDTPPLDMHPADAKARGLRDGTRVRVWNELGEVYLPLRVTDEVRPGVVCSLKGAWMRTSDNGQTISALTPGHHADLNEGACFNDARVEVAAAP